MTFESESLTRRRTLLVGATAVAGLAGCTEDTGGSDNGTDQNDSESVADSSSSDDEESEGTNTEDDASTDDSEQPDDTEETEDDEQSDDDTEDDSSEDEDRNERAAVRIEETYVTPISGDTIYPTYTPESTVTTIDNFAVELAIPSLDAKVGVDTEGVEFLLDGEPIDPKRLNILQEGSSDPVTVTLPIRQEIPTGKHTVEIELAESLVDLPDGQTTASARTEFTVEKPTGTLLTEQPPISKNTEFVIETNIAPGQRVELQMQTKPDVDPAFFAPKESDVNSDGRVIVTHDFVTLEQDLGESFAGTEAIISARPASEDVTLLNRTFTLNEQSG